MLFYDQIYYMAGVRKFVCVKKLNGEDWLCYKHPDGQLVTWRKLTPDDIKILDEGGNAIPERPNQRFA